MTDTSIIKSLNRDKLSACQSLSLKQIIATIIIGTLFCSVLYLILKDCTFEYRWFDRGSQYTTIGLLTAVCEYNIGTDGIRLAGFTANVLYLSLFAICYIGIQLIPIKKQLIAIILVVLLPFGVSFAYSYDILAQYKQAVIVLYNYQFWDMMFRTIWPLVFSFLALAPSFFMCVALSMLDFKRFKKYILCNFIIFIIAISLIVFAYWNQF